MLSETVPVLVAKRVAAASAYQRRCMARSKPWTRGLRCFLNAEFGFHISLFMESNYKKS
jgi:hypothetical protein